MSVSISDEMKLKINKACDPNSISVLPPHSRRSSIMAQPRSQPSQQSFSQGFSSQQNGIFSQLSQNSLDETLADTQRFGSQERDNSVRRVSCFAPISHSREESQIPISRTATSFTRRWSSAALPDQKCQLSEQIEHRITMIETSLSKFGMVLDSVQADVIQANKGTKELSLEVEGIRQKLNVQYDSLHVLNRGQEDIRTSLNAGFKSISDQLSKLTQLEQILVEVYNLPERIGTNIEKWNNELSECLSGDLKAISSSIKTLHQKNTALAILPPKVTGSDSSSQKPLLNREANPIMVSKQESFIPKIEMGNWTTVKAQQFPLSNRSGSSCNNLKQRKASVMVSLRHEKDQNAVIELDEESDDDVSCFIVDNELDSHLMDEVNKETARILKLARRRKRKHNSKKFTTNQKRGSVVLTFTMKWREEEHKFWTTSQENPSCCRSHLKRIVIEDYVGFEVQELDSVSFLLRSSSVLEELIIHRFRCGVAWIPLKDKMSIESTLKKLPRASTSCSIKVQ